MVGIDYTIWLAKESGEALSYYWPITVCLIGAVILTGVYNFPFLPGRFRNRHLLMFSPLVVAFLTLAWGSIMRHESLDRLAPDWPADIIAILLVIELLLSGGVILALKGYRWFVTSVVLLELWIGLAFAFIAVMSVSGDWL